jgi:hypothetical protein
MWGCIVLALQRGIICWVQHIGANRGVREMRLAVALVAAQLVHGCTPLNSGCGWLGQAWPPRSVWRLRHLRTLLTKLRRKLPTTLERRVRGAVATQLAHKAGHTNGISP